MLTASLAAAQTCPATGAMRLRIMTFNTWLQVTPGNSTEAFGISHEERAKLIAKRVAADDPDLVAFQEVNADDAAWALVDALKAKYPSFIRKIDQNNHLNDSGLMLFSKYPFKNPDAVIINHTIVGSNEDTCFGMNGPDTVVSNCNQVIYGSYQSNGSDWWANKGVGLVRVENICNSREPFNIAFTHTQSKGSEKDDDCAYGEDVQDLQEQLTTVRQLFETSFTTSSLRSQPTFFVGDLNLDGNQMGANTVTSRHRPYVITSLAPWTPGNPTGGPGGLCTYVKSSTFNEWQLTFDSKTNSIVGDVNKSFYACRGNRMTTGCSYMGPLDGTFFVDSWSSNTSTKDPGQTSRGETGMAGKPTNPNEGSRLDYVLHNEPRNSKNERTMCTQWARRGFRAGEGDDLSDHLSLTVDFNFPAPRCTVRPRQPTDPALEPGDEGEPLGPERVNFTETAQNIVFNGNTEPVPATTSIRFPGSMQWYVIDQAVPLEITATGSVAYEIFQATDLSSPVKEAVECTPLRGAQKCKLTLSHPPYYVRVFGASGNDPAKENRDVTGKYSIRFRVITCATQADACRLNPAEPLTKKWPGTLTNPSGGTDEMWFEVQTEFSKNGLQPELDFEAVHDFPKRFVGVNYVDPFAVRMANKMAVTVLGNLTGGFDSIVPAPSSSMSPTVTWQDMGSGIWRRMYAPRPSSLPGGVAWPEKYFIVFKRDPNHLLDKNSLTVTFRTTLSYFRPYLLNCDLERTYSGNDDLASSFRFGTKDDAMRQLGDVSGDFETWYRGSRMKQAGTITNGRTGFPFQLDWSLVGDGPGSGEGVRATLYEDVIDGDNYLMCNPTEGGACWPVYQYGKPIPALKKSVGDPVGPDDTGAYRYVDEASDPYYDYHFEYRVTHTRQACRGSTGTSASDCGANNTCSTSLPQFISADPHCVCTSNAGCPSGETCNTTTGNCQ